MAKEQAAYMEGTNTVIASSNGEYELRSGGSRNLRNNNPGNIEYGPTAIAMGAVGSDGRFAIFPDMNTGNSAVERLLSRSDYQNAPAVPSQGFSQGSIGAAIYRWAPPNENASGSYAKFVQDRTGLDANTPMSSLTPAQLTKVREAISFYEGHEKPYSTFTKDPKLKDNFNSFKEKAKDATLKNKLSMKNKSSGYRSSSKFDTSDLKNFINNDSNFQPNMLDDYDNVTYRIRIWILPEEQYKEYSALSADEQEKYTYPKKKIIYDSAYSTDISIDNISIDSVMGANGQTRKVFPLDVSFDITEPNGCSFIDDLKWNIQSIGYLDHKYVTLFFEVSFVGYHNIEHNSNPLMADRVYESSELIKRIIPVNIMELKCKITAAGAKYTVRTKVHTEAVGTSKDYFNFSKQIEISEDITDLKSFITILEDELNSAASENILSEIVKSGLLPDGKIYHFDTSELEENPSINLSILNNSGEASGKSAKYNIEPGTSIEKVLDDMTCALNTNKNLSVTNEDKVIEANDWPWLYRYVPFIQYLGQVPSTKQKVFKVTYKIQKYYNTRMILSQPTDHERQTNEMFKLLNNINYKIEKKYDYIFTSKSSQILSLDINFDFLWWVTTYENVAIRNNDDTGMTVSSALSINDKMSSVAGFALSNSSIPQNSSTLSNLLIAENKAQMSLNLNDPKVQSLATNDFQTTEDIVNQMPKQYKFSGFDACVLPGTNAWSDSNMNKDAENNTDIKAMSSFDQIYDTSDMIQMNLTIRGDPYWLCNPKLMDIRGDASFIFNMKTPKKRQSGELEDVSADYNTVYTIWGVYNVIKIKHNFKSGVFTQTIEAVVNGNFRFPINA